MPAFTLVHWVKQAQVRLPTHLLLAWSCLSNNFAPPTTETTPPTHHHRHNAFSQRNQDVGCVAGGIEDSPRVSPSREFAVHVPQPRLAQRCKGQCRLDASISIFGQQGGSFPWPPVSGFCLHSLDARYAVKCPSSGSWTTADSIFRIPVLAEVQRLRSSSNPGMVLL